jgi:glycosyltransferase involved in cell wall biosynthesis
MVLPLVSVIIPTYNRWPMVGEALESVLAQSFKHFELIVVDDGSTDMTSKELAKYGLSVRVVLQPRRGVGAARNYGVTIARGRYAAFLDSDDLWLPKKLAIQTAFMEQHPEVEICQTEELWLRKGIRVNPKAKHRKPSGDIFRPSLDLCLVSPSAVMMTKELFKRVGGFDESLPVCEDYDLWLRIAVDRSVAVIPLALTIKRGGHADQLSHSVWGMDRYRVRALQKLLRSGLRGRKREWALDALKRKVSVLSLGARKRGKESEALAYEAIFSEFIQETVNVGGADSRLFQEQRVTCSDLGAMVELGSAR